MPVDWMVGILMFSPRSVPALKPPSPSFHPLSFMARVKSFFTEAWQYFASCLDVARG